jgi:DNA-binding transcriptional regulator YiaG
MAINLKIPFLLIDACSIIEARQNVVLKKQMNKNTTPENKTERLCNIMREYNLKCADVAALLGREVNTVRIWRSKDPREIPDHALTVLEMTLAAKQAAK